MQQVTDAPTRNEPRNETEDLSWLKLGGYFTGAPRHPFYGNETDETAGQNERR